MTQNEQSIDSARTEPDAVVALRTSGLGAAEGRDEWRNTLGHLYAEMDVAWPDGKSELDAEWGGRPLGDLHISTIRCAAQTVVRSAQMVRSDACADYLVCLITAGHVEVQQRGRSAALQQGSFALLDLGAPFVFRSPASFRQVVVRVPGEMMSARLSTEFRRSSTARTFGSVASAAVIGRLLTDLAEAEVADSTATPFSVSAVEMLSAAVLESTPNGSRADTYHQQDLARIRHVMHEHLHDVEFTLSDLARAAGMSLRKVQKLVRTTGSTPNAWLYEARIDRAKTLLLATDQAVASVSDEVGFRDVSHFSRVFRRQTGMSPADFRGRARTRS